MKSTLIYISLIICIVLLFLLILLTGSVDISFTNIIDFFSGNLSANDIKYIILKESRLPFALTSLFAGGALSLAGLLLQTVFRNPLAGPSILGISSGASLGVAIVMLAGGAIATATGVSVGGCLGVIAGALIGSVLIIAILLSFSGVLKSATALLIIGLMLNYLSSSIIILLDYFAPAENLKSYVVWGMGSYSSVTIGMLPIMSILVIAALMICFVFIKPLDALLLSERYAENMGYNLRKLRTSLLLISGLLTAIITAFCGPIGFIGLIVPHISRMIFNTSKHSFIIPSTILVGALISMFCAFLTVVFSDKGILPINVITPIIGIPVIFYIMVFHKRIKYFN